MQTLGLFFDLENITKTPKKVAYLWQFFLYSPDSPKQPRTSFQHYDFFIQPSPVGSLHELYTQFLPGKVRKESNVPKQKNS